MRLKILEEVKDHLPEGFLPYTIISIYIKDEEIGRIVLREGTDEERYYDGHISYHIDEKYRGHHYAYQACLLLKDYIDKEHVIITCSPDNIASKKTIEKLQCEYIETVEVPKYLRKYFNFDETIKCIYKWQVK